MALLRKLVEDALVNYFTDEAVTTNIYAGLSVGTKAPPCVICKAVSAENQDLTGTYGVTCQLIAKASLAAGLDAFDTLCTNVATAVNAGDLLAELVAHAPAGLVVRGVGVDDRIEYTEEDDVFIETRTVVLFCAC